MRINWLEELTINKKMAVVKFSRKEFEKSVKITPQIEEKISMFGTHLESMDTDKVEVEISPNRPDLLSLQGYMRSFLAFIGKKTGLRQYKVNAPEKNYEVRVSHYVRNIRPYTACAIVKNLKFDNEKIKEIMEMQEKIHVTLGRNRKKIAIGIYPLEKIALPITYEARRPQDIKFMPLDSTREMNGNEILKEHQTGREYAHLLQGSAKFPVFVDAAGEILSMPPIINSEKTGKVSESTKEVFVECSGFDFNALKKTLNIIVTMLAEMGGEIYQMKIGYFKSEITPNLEPEKIKLNKEHANKLLGLELKEKEIKELIEKMGYSYSPDGTVLVPAWRTDVLHEVDIIEDIAIAYGYDKLVPEVPAITGVGGEDKKERIKRKVAEILAGLGMLEISSYHLLMKEEIQNGQKGLIEVEKSKTEYRVLRPNLLLPALKVLSKNVDAEYPQKIFEIGKVFAKDEKSETGIKEQEKLCIAITPGNFTEMKQVLDCMFISLGLEYQVEEAIMTSYIEGRTAKIFIGNDKDRKEIGVMGEIHPSVLRDWHLKMLLVCLEIDLDELIGKF